MRKKIISIILLVAMVLTMAAGCGKKEDKKDYFVFYVNNELTKVVAKKITLQHTSSGKAQVKDSTQSKNPEYRSDLLSDYGGFQQGILRYETDGRDSDQGCNCKDTVAAEPVCDLYCGWKTTCGCLGSLSLIHI